MLCYRCNKSEAVLEHHTSYSPEIKIWLCRRCHSKLHAQDYKNGINRINRLKRLGKQKHAKAWRTPQALPSSPQHL